MWVPNFCFFALVVACAFNGLYAGTVSNHGQQRKFYIAKKAVKIVKGTIVIETKHGPVSVQTLRTDQYGMYVFKKDVIGTAKALANKRIIKCRCGREFSSEDAYWWHIDYGQCRYYPVKR